jgi:hypothetical protein
LEGSFFLKRAENRLFFVIQKLRTNQENCYKIGHFYRAGRLMNPRPSAMQNVLWYAESDQIPVNKVSVI